MLDAGLREMGRQKHGTWRSFTLRSEAREKPWPGEAGLAVTQLILPIKATHWSLPSCVICLVKGSFFGTCVTESLQLDPHVSSREDVEGGRKSQWGIASIPGKVWGEEEQPGLGSEG